MEETSIAPKKKSFDFIDSIRGLSMIGIVLEHSSVFWNLKYADFGERFIQASYMQFFKSATIAFFLISGFLINYKFTEYTPLQYIKNRFKNTIGPWLFWIIVLIVLSIGQRYFLYLKSGDADVLPSDWYEITIGQILNLIFHSSYWFILNFLICIAILLIFKKQLYKIGFGICLGLISLFYSVNLYYAWIPTEHTTALFGFVVYLWLGVFLNRNYEKVKYIMSRVSFTTLILTNLALFLLANFETIYLMDLGVQDPFNTLRITNILYSLGMFALLLKMGNMPAVKRILKPRETTYGVYLLHLIVIERILSEIVRPFKLKLETMSAGEVALYSFARFLIVYVLTYLIARLILKTKFKWSIGSKA